MPESDTTITKADSEALAGIHAVEPVWTGVRLASDAMDFPPYTILHAGPPIELANIAAPILNSAVMAALYEGWARDMEEAKAKILAGEIALAPAQDHRAMVPLAAVLSPGMAVQIIVDRNAPQNKAFSPLNGGMKHAQRFGLASERVLAHLRWINGNLASTLSIIVDRDVPLLEIADEAIARGDDCHGKTAEATRLVIERIAPRLGIDTLERRFLDTCPGFFLNLWMAAVKCMASAGEIDGSSIVTAMGGNGIATGVKVGGRPEAWITIPAAPPEGILDSGFCDADRLGAVGDSALVDAMGFGAMLPSNREVPGPTPLPGLLPRTHPGFQRTRIEAGLPACNAGEQFGSPVIALGILDRLGKHGRIGGGLYTAPASLFRTACQSI
ncbi:DUF1116 domain-containing protein [Agrobacterium vitis]|uniref:DUF1116 domain-containing protein n=1 Tax=Agrobacterium vitis TaxID=373 RepID=UPI003D2AAE34